MISCTLLTASCAQAMQQSLQSHTKSSGTHTDFEQSKRSTVPHRSAQILGGSKMLILSHAWLLYAQSPLAQALEATVTGVPGMIDHVVCSHRGGLLAHKFLFTVL
jgi:hypothetical protein